MNNYDVTVCRVGYSHRVITVEATSEHHAEEVALDIAGDFEFTEASSDYTVEGVSLIPYRHPTIDQGEGNPWEEDPDYPPSEWQLDVRENNTRLGYQDWVAHKMEADRHDKAQGI